MCWYSREGECGTTEKVNGTAGKVNVVQQRR